LAEKGVDADYIVRTNFSKCFYAFLFQYLSVLKCPVTADINSLKTSSREGENITLAKAAGFTPLVLLTGVTHK
jgi:hypothetical protein